MATTKQMFAEILKKLDELKPKPAGSSFKPSMPMPVIAEDLTPVPYVKDANDVYYIGVEENGGPERYAAIIVFLESQGVKLVEEYAAFKKDWPGYF